MHSKLVLPMLKIKPLSTLEYTVFYPILTQNSLFFDHLKLAHSILVYWKPLEYEYKRVQTSVKMKKLESEYSVE